jgi:hypothetical protein
MFDHSFFRQTGQLWKVYVFAGTPIISLILVAIGFKLASQGNESIAALLVIIGLTLALTVLVSIALTLKCPKCQTRLLMNALKQPEHNKGLAWLLTMRSCPVCEERQNQSSSGSKS